MTNYNYLEDMVADVKAAIEENAEIDRDELEYNRSGLEEKLRDDLWIDDSVTGNASGSYYCNSNMAKDAVIDNLDLLKEACEEFGCKEELGERFIDGEWEWMDVTIRCYLLGQAISEALDEIEEELEVC